MEPVTTASDSLEAIVVIDHRQLLRECLMHSIKSLSKFDVMTLQRVEQWMEFSKTRRASLFALCIASTNREELWREVNRMLQIAEGVPTAVLSEWEDLATIVKLMGQGVRGCIPIDVSLDVAIAALALIRAGGTFVPANVLVMRAVPVVEKAEQPAQANVLVMPAEPVVEKAEHPVCSDIFTARQVAVANELRSGKPNKLIAHALSMRESTVKVHIRNIMKKVKARNRTQVAILVNEMLKADRDSRLFRRTG